ncbi:MAG: hypothetical protein JOZ14_12990 [Acidobacteria bacterium]|nr:hypothetical protein [Acidobacteriota bacterium]
MLRIRHFFPLRPTAAFCLFLIFCPLAAPQDDGLAKSGTAGVIWSDPGDVRSRNLVWGPGGEEHQPRPPFTFLQEDLHGTNPKFYVRDADGKKWTAKLGLEAKPETAASRLMWSVGYPANENYFFPQIHVNNMPARLRRGQALAGQGGDVPNVRLQRHPGKEKKEGNWNWRRNPFYGTREFNGLRVMMGLIANWDLNDDNNAVLGSDKDSDAKIYEVTDVGTAFGTAGKSYNDVVSKGNLDAYRRTKLIAHVHQDEIDLNFPRRPSPVLVLEFEWRFFVHQLRMRWLGKHIPRRDAKWIGSLLSQLTPEQIADAFRAAGYSQQEIGEYTQAVNSRIQELNSL